MGGGYCRLRLRLQTGMTHDGLQRQGLISVRNLWMKAHGYA